MHFPDERKPCIFPQFAWFVINRGVVSFGNFVPLPGTGKGAMSKDPCRRTEMRVRINDY